jgi:L-ornithine N5-oxygenase
MMNKHTHYDVIGIGFGPANIALAIAMEENNFQGRVRFFERKSGPYWHEQMLLPGSDIQNNPLRDMVTPRNPRSRYSFTNFLFENNRLFEHLNLGLEFPLRREFAEYVQWVAGFFEDDVQYRASVEELTYDDHDGVYNVTLASGERFTAKALVVAPGRTPRIPTVYQNLSHERVFHLTQYQKRIEHLSDELDGKHIAVVGGSQSAVEIMLDLRRRFPNATLHNLQRGYGFRLKDTSQFSMHVYFPSFVDYYYICSADAKKRINQHLHYTNYSAADGDVIHELYIQKYEDKLDGRQRINIYGYCQVDAVSEVDHTLHFQAQDINTLQPIELPPMAAVILATGFRDLGTGEQDELNPAILKHLHPSVRCTAQGVIHIERDYRLTPAEGKTLGPLYLNGLCESSHGYGDAGSFSLLALRSQEIFESLSRELVANNTKSEAAVRKLQGA